jgi:hypothetical protein
VNVFDACFTTTAVVHHKVPSQRTYAQYRLLLTAYCLLLTAYLLLLTAAVAQVQEPRQEAVR